MSIDNEVRIIQIGRKFQITFSPAEKQLREIEKWLITERKKIGEGFYCNWSNIEYSFEKLQMAVISIKNKSIGFATWEVTDFKCARIEIVEIKPIYRKKGIGRILTNSLFDFLRDKGVCAVELQCSPETSKPFWISMGFTEFPDSPEKYSSGSNARLYLILKESFGLSSFLCHNETIELWNEEPFKTKKITPTNFWNLEFIEGTRKLLKPIIYPGHNQSRIRWKVEDKVVFDDKVKRFRPEIAFGSFIIIKDLPYTNPEVIQ